MRPKMRCGRKTGHIEGVNVPENAYETRKRSRREALCARKTVGTE